ncbi:MAG: dihydroorotate dehydrogenase electron transfer subunit [Bacteroidales bacterium]|nr:dihydroorotate dehydrogenase electron transfer subunit [Bacteroidales bacterium]
MKRIEDLKVQDIRWLNSNSYVLNLSGSDAIQDIRPGNFAEIRVDNHPDVFLRRPFSYLDHDIKEKTVSFFIKAIGKGTKKLGTLEKGETVNIIHPLGNAFTIPESKKVLITGGGSGIAPFIMLGRELKAKGNEVHILTGGRTAEDILFTEEFREYGEVFCTTEDGSIGEKGLLTQHSIFSGKAFNYDMIYTCGPDGMMKAVASIAKARSIACEASLENLMACGFGVCLCCIQETTEGNKCVCTEGPVFNINELKW